MSEDVLWRWEYSDVAYSSDLIYGHIHIHIHACIHTYIHIWRQEEISHNYTVKRIFMLRDRTIIRYGYEVTARV